MDDLVDRYTVSDRLTDPVTGVVTITTDGPAELASWYFPDESDDNRRAALASDIAGLVDRWVKRAALQRQGWLDWASGDIERK